MKYLLQKVLNLQWTWWSIKRGLTREDAAFAMKLKKLSDPYKIIQYYQIVPVWQFGCVEVDRPRIVLTWL